MGTNCSSFDLIICGGGINGLMAAYLLLPFKNLKVLVLEASSSSGHPYSGSYGETRLSRRSYFENGTYIPWVDKSLPIWKKIDEDAGGNLLTFTKMILGQIEEGAFFSQLFKETSPYSVPITLLSHQEAIQQFPFLNIEYITQIAVEEGSFVFHTVPLFHYLKKKIESSSHIQILYNTPVTDIQKNQQIVVRGLTKNFNSQKLLVTMGGWLNLTFPELHLPITLYESPQFWFKEKKGEVHSIVNPFLFSLGEDIIYGFPDYGSGVKIASYRLGQKITDPNDRKLKSDFSLPFLQETIKKLFPGLDPHPIQNHNCFFDLGPNDNILFQYHLENKDIVLLGAGSGHGFKMAPYLAQKALSMLFKEIPV